MVAFEPWCDEHGMHCAHHAPENRHRRLRVAWRRLTNRRSR